MEKFNSTIFRTITDEATGATKSIGLFGKSFNELKNILSSIKTKGLFKANVVSDKDIQCIKDYNSLIEAGIKDQNQLGQATKGASDATKQMIKNANGNAIALNKMTIGAKMASVAMNALSIAGNMIAMWAITKGIELLVNWIDELILTSEEAKEKLATTESELESVNQQIEELNTQIKTLESLETPSITDKEDLERLKAENEELRIRQRYLEKQKQNDEKNVSDAAKRDYKAKYTSTSREDINERKNALDTPVSPEGIASSYLTGGSTITSSPYAAGQQTSEEYDKLADLIAQYELYSEKKKEAIANDDAEAIEKYNQKLGTVETELMNCRTELQGFADDMALTGDSQDLENVKGDLALIDETLFSAGERLVDYINNTLSDADSEKLTKLAQNGELTADVLKENFSEVDEYLKQNGLTLEDLISILDLFQEELKNTTPDKMSIPSLEELHSNLDAIQDAYDTVASAIEEYNKQGYLSVDTYQSLMELEPQYLQYLMDEEGNLRLGTDAMNDYTSALIDNMAMKKMESIADYINTLSAEERQLYLTKDATDEASASLVDFAASVLQDKIALNELSEDELEGLKSMMASVASWAESAKAGLEKGGLGGGGSASKEFSETIDFFEERVENLNDAISLLDKNLENVSGSFAKNTLVGAEIDLNAEKMNNYSDALAMYSQKANEALSSIPADLRDKVVNGAVAINEFVGDGNKAVVESIKEYQKWSDKISDCQQELAELKETIRDLELEKFNNIMEDFQSQFDIRENSKSLIDKQIDLFREAGELIGESFYQKSIEQSQKQLQILEQEKVALTEQLTSALASDNIQRGTDEWLEMVNSLTELDGQILNCKTSIEELDNAILDLHTEIFERIQNEFSNLNSELENLGGLFENFDVANSDGAWSKEGLSRLGLLSQQFELARHQVEQYNIEIKKLNEDYANGKYSAIEYSDRLADLSEKQWDAVNSAESMKDAIVELNKQRVDIQIEGIEKEISAYEELIQSKIDALDAEKSLADYRASISDKNKSITDIERQLAAMEGDNTASTIAKRKQLEQQLADARKDLEETQYDHSIEQQKDALNKELDRFTEEKDAEIKKLEESLEDRETLIYNSMESVKENSAIIGQEITDMATQHGITISDAIIDSWASGEDAIASYGSTLSAQSSKFIRNIMNVENEVYALQAKANNTATSLSMMFGTRADNLIVQLTNSYNSASNLNIMTNALQSSLRSTLEGGYNVSSITSALNSITDAANRAKSALDNLNTDTTVTVKSTGNGVGGGAKDVSVHKYASGTRSTKGNLIITDEDGQELKLPKLSSGNYTIANEGSQILTKAQTDNIFDWSKINPDVLIPNGIRSSIADVRLPNIVNKNMSNAPSLHLDNLIHIDKVDTTNIQQMETIANKAVDKLVDRMYNGVKYRK